MKQKILLIICLLSMVGIRAQTVGTTSTNPIVVTAGTTSLINQSPDANQKWYKITPTQVNILIKSKLTAQSFTNSLVSAEFFITDASNNVLASFHDSLRVDSTTRFAFAKFNLSNRIFLKYNFSNSCGTCTALPTKFDIFISEVVSTACPTNSSTCNLVNNPSFEDSNARCFYATAICSWSLPIVCTNSLLTASTDYFCNSSGSSGSAYFGAYLWSQSLSGPTPNNGSYREYLQAQMSSNLIVGKVYQASVYTALNPITFYTKNLSFFFTSGVNPCQNAAYNNINTGSYTGQKVDVTSSVMTNTVWQKYVVTFTANSSYDRFTLGNFDDNTTTTTVTIPGGYSPGGYSQSYYYIDDVSIKTPSISITNPAAICAGNTLQLNPTVCELDNTTYNYIWSPAIGLSATNTLSPIFSGTTTTTYTVSQIGVGSYGTITNTAVVVVTVSLPSATFALSSALNVICTNLGQTTNTLTATGSAGLTYTWQPGGILGSSITVTPSSTTIYTVTATTPKGCQPKNTIVVNVQNACCTSTAPTFTSNYYNGGTFNGPMVINSDITFGGTLNFPTFQNGEFLIAPNVKITVLSGVGDFIVQGAHLYACTTTMWQGIEVQNGSRFLAIGSSTTGNTNLIEDAITAVSFTTITNASPGYPVEVTNTIFNKNYIAINVSSAITPTIPIFRVSQNVFTSRNFTFTPTSWPSTNNTGVGLRVANNPTTGLTPPFNLQSAAIVNLKSPYNLQSARTGIQMNDVAIGIANSTTLTEVGVNFSETDFNVFDALQYGIDATNSNLGSINNVFQNTMRLSCGRTCIVGGTAIRSIVNSNVYPNNKLNLSTSGTGSTSPSYGNRFWNCHTGVEGSNVYQFNVSYATFRSTQSTTAGISGVNPGNTGILLGTNRFLYFIANNEFTNINNAINAPIVTGTYNISGSNQTGIYANNFIINTNYFGPQTASTTAIGNN